jgi:hypothetical protein
MTGIKILHEHRYVDRESHRDTEKWDIIFLANGRCYEAETRRRVDAKETDALMVHLSYFDGDKGSRCHVLNHIGFPMRDMGVPTQRHGLLEQLARLAIQIKDGE